jgi:Xaa-Pro aminopeptidase
LSTYAERRKKLLSKARGKQVLATTGGNLFYLTDFFGDGVGVVKPDKTIVVTSLLEGDRVEEVGNDVEVLRVKKRTDLPKVVMSHLERGEVLADSKAQFKKSKRILEKPEVFLEARRVKDAEELRRITKASAVLDSIFRMLEAGELGAGRTEWEVGAAVMKEATTNETTPSSADTSLCPTIVASGPNGALPHSELTSRKIRRGDFVVVDIFFRYKGYHSDATRTFAVGSATGEMKRRYEAVREAQATALDVIKEGARCADVNEAAVAVLKRHKLDKYLNHSIGHGVGIDIHELPNISKVSKEVLRVNDVVTDEPGVYFSGEYGIRIEDTVQVGAGPKILTRYTKDLVTVG